MQMSTLRYSLTILAVITAFVTSVAVAQQPSSARQTFDRMNAATLTAQGDGPMDNIKGGIVWSTSYQLDAYVDMYLATGDESYLDDFVSVCDKVIAARADKTGQLDYAGRITRGWLSGHHYTHGGPAIIPDRDGSPSLKLETIAHGHNNLSHIEIVSDEVGPTFTIKLRNTVNEASPVERQWVDVTMDTVEQQINPVPGVRGYLRVTRLGDQVPIACPPFVMKTQLVTVHGHHTGRILTPVTRFCELILAKDGPERFRDRARVYLQAAEESMREHDRFFIEDGDAGYTIFEKGAPVWSDGAPEVHNTIAASGSAYVHLYGATGNAYYLDKAERLARLIMRNTTDQPDGTKLMYYWWGIGRTGWTPEDNVSENCPLWPGEMANVENISHFQLTLMFVIDCYRHGIVFTRDDLESWARTFMTKIYVPGERGGRMTLRINGDDLADQPGRENQNISAFAELGSLVDPATTQACRSIYDAQFRSGSSGYRMACWAALACAEAELSQASQ
jgi:hypothetical protein